MSGSEQESASGDRDLGQAVTSGADGASANGASPDGASPDGTSPDGAEAASADEARDEGTAARGGPARARRKRSFWRELPVLIVVALLLAVVIKTYFIQAFFIPSGSMENTLRINDRVLVNKIVYDTRGIHRGDIVVFNGNGSWGPGAVPAKGNIFQQFADGFASMFGFGHPGDILIKRVIGLPGDHVVCCDGQGRVTVNGVPLNERSYLFPGNVPSESRFDINVQPGRLWVMGDHRFISDDSRDHMGDPGGGTVPESAVVGRAFIIIWPFSHWRILPIPATFEQPKLAGPSPGGPAAPPATAAGLPDRLEPAGPLLPLSLGFAGALPLTWLYRRLRLTATRRVRRTAARRRPGPSGRSGDRGQLTV